MGLRGPLMSTGALGLAVLSVAAVAVWTSVNRGRAIDANTIRIDGTGILFLPPPSAVPAMTARQAWARFTTGQRRSAISPDTTMRLGLLTVPIGPYCGRECDGSASDGLGWNAIALRPGT